MSRRHFSFGCDGAQLAATLDLPLHRDPAHAGLLIVSGGNEIRAGAWGSQAMLAQRIAEAGFPVLRFDRRGVGDSEGVNFGFASSAADIAAAIAAFQRELPGLMRVIAFGNCDAAAALMLAQGAGCAGLVLANPWTFDPAGVAAEADPAPQMTPQLLRRHYWQRLTNPRAIWRALSGQVALGGLVKSLRGAAKADAPPSQLAQEIGEGLAAFAGPATILIAEADRTGQAFLAHWDKADPRLRRCPEASHSFVEPAARVWLAAQVLAALAGD